MTPYNRYRTAAALCVAHALIARFLPDEVFQFAIAVEPNVHERNQFLLFFDTLIVASWLAWPVVLDRMGGKGWEYGLPIGIGLLCMWKYVLIVLILSLASISGWHGMH